MRSDGEIVELPPDVSDAEAQAAGLVPIPPDQLDALRAAGKAVRIAWYRNELRAISRARLVEREHARESGDASQLRWERNKRKKARQRRRVHA